MVLVFNESTTFARGVVRDVGPGDSSLGAVELPNNLAFPREGSKMIDQFEDEYEQELEAVTDPQVLLLRMRECVDFACRLFGKVIRAEVGSVAFSNALEAAEASILAAIDLQRRYEQLVAECADSLNR